MQFFLRLTSINTSRDLSIRIVSILNLASDSAFVFAYICQNSHYYYDGYPNLLAKNDIFDIIFRLIQWIFFKIRSDRKLREKSEHFFFKWKIRSSILIASENLKKNFFLNDHSKAIYIMSIFDYKAKNLPHYLSSSLSSLPLILFYLAQMLCHLRNFCFILISSFIIIF